jgi:hypothetical protein
MQDQLTATRKRIEQIFEIRNESHDQTVLAAEYREMTDREDVLLGAMRRSRSGS